MISKHIEDAWLRLANQYTKPAGPFAQVNAPICFNWSHPRTLRSAVLQQLDALERTHIRDGFDSIWPRRNKFPRAWFSAIRRARCLVPRVTVVADGDTPREVPGGTTDV